jgi:hypothetical protein
MGNSYPSSASGQPNATTNSMGPTCPESDLSYQEPTGTGVPAAPAASPQSPSGSVTNQSNTFSFNNTITDTQEYLTNVLDIEGVQQGTASLPGGVAGSVGQPVIAGVAATALQVNAYSTGAVGTPGTKFS